MSGNVIFFGVSFICACLFVLSGNVLFVMPVGWFVFRLVKNKDKILLGVMLVGFLLGAAVTGLQQAAARRKMAEINSVSVASGKLTLNPGDFSLTEDYVSGTGRLTTADFSQKVQFGWSLNSDEATVFEKNFYQINLAVTGELTDFRRQENTHGFDQQKFYAEKGIYRKLEIEKVSAEKVALTPWSVLKGVPVYLRQLINARLPKHLASFYLSAFLAEKDETFYDASLATSRSGLWQLFSFSGLQFIFLLGLLRKLLLRLGVTLERVDYWQLLAGIILIMLLGYKVNLVRGILFSFVLRRQRGDNFLRHFSRLDLWMMTLIVTQFLFPWQLFGFSGQISYFITFFWCCPLLLKGQQFVLPFLVAPLFWYHFFEWSPLVLISFIFLRPLLQGAMWVSLIMLGPLLIFSGSSFNLFIDKLYQLFLAGITRLTALNFHWVVGRAPLIVTALLFIALFIVLFCYERRQNKNWLLALVLLFLLGANWQKLNPAGQVSFVNVRQGDSAVMIAPFAKKVVLIDVGGRLNFSARKLPSIASQTLIPYLKSQGVKKIDAIYISHADADHMGDLLEVTQHFIVKKIYIQKGAGQQEIVRSTLNQLDKKIAIAPVKLKQQEIFSRHNKLTVLGPAQGDGTNNDSVQILGKFADTTFLFTGDIEETGEKAFVERFPLLSVGILKVAHHGSKTSTTPDLLEIIKPQVAIISCGLNNSYGHPAPVVLERLEATRAKIFRTDLEGTITFSYGPFQPRRILPLTPLETSSKK